MRTVLMFGLLCGMLLASCEGNTVTENGGTPISVDDMAGLWRFDTVIRRNDTCDFTYDPWAGIDPHYLLIGIDRSGEDIAMGDCGDDDACDYDYEWNAGMSAAGRIEIREFEYIAIDLWDASGIECYYWAYSNSGSIRFSSSTRATLTARVDFSFDGEATQCAAMNEALKAEWPTLFPDGVHECSELVEATLVRVE